MTNSQKLSSGLSASPFCSPFAYIDDLQTRPRNVHQIRSNSFTLPSFSSCPSDIINLMAKKFLPPAFEMAEKASFLGSSASISFALMVNVRSAGVVLIMNRPAREVTPLRWIRRLSQTILLRQVVRGFSLSPRGFYSNWGSNRSKQQLKCSEMCLLRSQRHRLKRIPTTQAK